MIKSSTENEYKLLLNSLETEVGRDKFFRILQYGGNFLAENYLNSNPPLSPNDSKYVQMRAMTTSFSMVRKCIRFGKHHALFKRIQQNCRACKNAKNEGEFSKYIFHLLKVCSDISLFGYFVTDHFMFFQKFFPIMTQQKAQFNSWFNDVLWFIQEVIDIVARLIQMNSSDQNLPQDKYNLMSLMINVLNSLTALGFFSGKIRRYYTTLFGTISTLIWWKIYIDKNKNQLFIIL